MYKYLFLPLLILLVLSCKSTFEIPTSPETTKVASDIKFLSSDELKGRATGSIGEKMAAEYIAERFKDLGYSPKGTSGYFQKFTGYDSTNPHGDMDGDKIPVNGRNVVGFLDNGADYTIVIGAHYDHLGMGEFGSLYQGPAEIHNGADDNASGVAVMLFLAEQLKQKKYSKSNYLVIAFSGEEKGLWGSNYWTKNPTYDLSKINYMINLDMVGRLQNNRLAINGVGTSPAWKAVDKVNKKFELVKSESGIGPSDHSSFYLVDIPVVHFFTGQHEDYHKPTDDFDKVNYAGCFEVGGFILGLVDRVGYKKIAFTKTKDDSVDTPDFKVTLGVIPDYMFTEEGMRIDGVREGKTAAAAGIMKGDIVKRMGDIEVKDMMSYMKALGAFEKGQTILVVVERDGKEIEKEVTFK